ncbi:MAG: class E sortase [Thermoleophilia bacterium]|nr:class E sortase [Thermoleophilia bacterium]
MDRLTYPDIARIFGTGLIATGTGLLVFVLVTILWGDPFTRLTENSAQQDLKRQYATFTENTSGPLTNDPTLDPELTRATANRFRKRIPLGAPVGTISIPSIHLNKRFVHGARHPDLEKGPGLYKERGLPGSGGPIAIAGHRTTFGAPFLDVDKIKTGDKIVLTVPYGRFTYTVTRQQIITPTDWSILDYGAEERTSAARAIVARTGRCIGSCEHLVLTACHPKYSAAKRYAVYAKLTNVQLRSVAPPTTPTATATAGA